MLVNQTLDLIALKIDAVTIVTLNRDLLTTRLSIRRSTKSLELTVNLVDELSSRVSFTVCSSVDFQKIVTRKRFHHWSKLCFQKTPLAEFLEMMSSSAEDSLSSRFLLLKMLLIWSKTDSKSATSELSILALQSKKQIKIDFAILAGEGDFWVPQKEGYADQRMSILSSLKGFKFYTSFTTYVDLRSRISVS